MYLTSKGNSYGIGRNAWYDGEVAKGRIEAGYAHTIRITDVINTRSIQHCSPNPFYEIQWCMTLTDMGLTEYMGLTENSATTEISI